MEILLKKKKKKTDLHKFLFNNFIVKFFFLNRNNINTC